MLVEVPVLDGDDCARQVDGNVLRRQLVALEDPARGEDLVVSRLNDRDMLCKRLQIVPVETDAPEWTPSVTYFSMDGTGQSI